MEADMSANQVISEIKHLSVSGSNLNKKIIKKSNPQLMRNALYYFADWDSAIEKSIS